MFASQSRVVLARMVSKTGPAIRRRARDDPQYLTRRSLLVQGLGQFTA